MLKLGSYIQIEYACSKYRLSSIASMDRFTVCELSYGSIKDAAMMEGKSRDICVWNGNVLKVIFDSQIQ